MARCNDIDERYDLLTRRIPSELVTEPDLIYTALAKERKPRVMWATAPTGKPHIGYFIPMLKFAEFLRADCEVIVSLFDSYSFLDNVKYPMEQVKERMYVYQYTVEAALACLGVDPRRVIFKPESDHEKSSQWQADMWKMCTIVPQQAVRDAWDRAYNPNMLGPMLCPIHQALCEEYLDLDIQFGGTDQMRLFAFADKYMPQIGYKKRGHIMNPMLPNLMGGKMSSSHPPETKIMLCEEPDVIAAKIRKAYDNAEDKLNGGPMLMLRDVLIPVSQLQQERARDPAAWDARGLGNANLPEPFWTEASPEGTIFTVAQQGQSFHFQSFEDIVSAVQNGTVELENILTAIIAAVTRLLEPARTIFKNSRAWQAADAQGYPQDMSSMPMSVQKPTLAAPVVPVQAPSANGITTGASKVAASVTATELTNGPVNGITNGVAATTA